MKLINIAIVGIGNCASSLVQGLEHYREGTNDAAGLMHWEVGGYEPSDIKVVAAWDVDARKVGKDVAEAIFAKPNCTAVFAATICERGALRVIPFPVNPRSKWTLRQPGAGSAAIIYRSALRGAAS